MLNYSFIIKLYVIFFALGFSDVVDGQNDSVKVQIDESKSKGKSWKTFEREFSGLEADSGALTDDECSRKSGDVASITDVEKLNRERISLYGKYVRIKTSDNNRNSQGPANSKTCLNTTNESQYRNDDETVSSNKKNYNIKLPRSTKEKKPADRSKKKDQNDVAALWNANVDNQNVTSRPDDFDDRIIGGKLMAVEKLPYLVVILRFHRMICGGTLITATHVLTAAHCVTARNVYRPQSYDILNVVDYSVRQGSNFSEVGGAQIPARDIFVHPDYLQSNTYHVYMDLAVIWLKYGISIQRNQLAKLPWEANIELNDIIDEGLECITAGWGVTRAPKIHKRKRALLLGAALEIMDYKTCEKFYLNRGYRISYKAHICTYKEGKDACQGDSGGGLYCDDYIWGVTSWGIGCAEKDTPGIFARVDTNREFLQNVIDMHPSLLQRSGAIGRNRPLLRFMGLALYHFFIIITILVSIEINSPL